MVNKPNTLQDYDHLIRLLQIAKTLESGGHFMAARLFRVAALSEETRCVDQTITPDNLQSEIDIALTGMTERGASPTLLDAIGEERKDVDDIRYIPLAELSEAYVCQTCGATYLNDAPATCSDCGADQLTFQIVRPAYFSQTLPPHLLLKTMASAPDQLEAMIKDLNSEQLVSCPIPGEWNIRDNLWHLLVSQGLLIDRIETIVGQEAPIVEGDEAESISSKQSLSAFTVLSYFRRSREMLINWLESLSPDDWSRLTGPDIWGTINLLEQVNFFIRHERTHWSQIAEIRRLVTDEDYLSPN